MYLQMNHGTLYFSKSKIQKFFEWMQMEDNRVYRSICWRVLVVKKSLQCKHTININLLFPLQLSCFLLSHLYFIDTHKRAFVFCHFYEYNFIELCLNAFKFYVKTQQYQNNDYTIEKGRWCKMWSQSWQKNTATTWLSCCNIHWRPYLGINRNKIT